MVRQELIARKFNAHHATDCFLEFKNPDAVQFPWRVRDLGRDQPSRIRRIKTEPSGQENIERRLFGNP
jgi:hypothetical protein